MTTKDFDTVMGDYELTDDDDLPFIDVTCDRCDFRLVRGSDPTARGICGLCANYTEGDDATR